MSAAAAAAAAAAASGGGDGKPGQTAADQSYVKAATLCRASRSSTLLHSSEASAEPVNMSVMADALETSQAARLPGHR